MKSCRKRVVESAKEKAVRKSQETESGVERVVAAIRSERSESVTQSAEKKFESVRNRKKRKSGTKSKKLK